MQHETGPGQSVDPPAPPEHSDDALAQDFADQHGGGMRYVAAWGRWYAWMGTRWELDSTLHALDRSRAICREAAAKCQSNQPRVKTALASAKTVFAIERMARADRRIAATVEQWDANPNLFNTEAMLPGHDGGVRGD